MVRFKGLSHGSPAPAVETDSDFYIRVRQYGDELWLSLSDKYGEPVSCPNVLKISTRDGGRLVFSRFTGVNPDYVETDIEGRIKEVWT